MTFRIATILKGLVVAAILGGVWFFFAPTQLGGSSSFLIIRGISMEPAVVRGDLVIARKQSDYSIGEVVAYRNSLSKQRVLHRIVERDGERFVFKGDNNNYKDDFEPTRSDLIGKEWIRVPHAGSALGWIQKPLNAAILAAAAMLLAASGGLAADRKRRRRARGEPAATPPRSLPHVSPLLLLPALLFAISGALALVSFGRSSEKAITVPDLYRQTGTFTYFGSAEKGPVYPSGTVSTGQTAFTRLVPKLDVSFRYSLESERSAVISGRASLKALLSSDDTGWSRTITLTPTEEFSGKTATVEGVLDLEQLEQVIGRVQSDTGEQATNFHLVLQPLVIAQGLVESEKIDERLTPQLGFIFTGRRLQIDGASENAATTVTSSGSGVAQTTNSIDLRLAELSVPNARVLSLGGLALALLGLLVVGAVTIKHRLSDEPEQIERLYGYLLLPILELPAFDRTAEVDSIDALATLAERYDRAILHQSERGVHTYVLPDDGVAYRYVAFDPELLAGIEVMQPNAEPEQPAWPSSEPPGELPPEAIPQPQHAPQQADESWPPPEPPWPQAPGGGV